MGVGAGLCMYDVSLKSSRSLFHLLMSSCLLIGVATVGDQKRKIYTRVLSPDGATYDGRSLSLHLVTV